MSLIRLLFLSCYLSFSLYSWSSQSNYRPKETPSTSVRASSLKAYRITETFDSGNKGNYSAADVILPTGPWNFTNSLLGSLEGDQKIGEKAVRLKSGSIEMKFDILGLKMLYIHHAKYSNDGTAKWQLLMSVNGAEYKKIGKDIVENNTTLKLDSFAIKVSGRVRFKIVNVSSGRINIDEITFRGVGDSGLGIGKTENEADEAISTSTSAAAPRDVVPGFDAPPFTGENGNIYLGNPSNAKPDTMFADNYLIDHKYYVVSYSRSRAIPNWVSWHVDASNLGTADRRNNFAAWSGLPSGWYQVQSNSYSYSTFGFDRGHNCP
ncbi:MAG: DNA/RNA non-specific endonuclease, partial [Sphingobacteriaceae bacterium]